jgi:hypothetical protein
MSDATEGAIEGRLAILRGRFGDRLSDEEWMAVRQRIAKAVERGEQLRRAPLTNGDEPEIVFVPYREDRP